MRVDPWSDLVITPAPLTGAQAALRSAGSRQAAAHLQACILRAAEHLLVLMIGRERLGHLPSISSRHAPVLRITVLALEGWMQGRPACAPEITQPLALWADVGCETDARPRHGPCSPRPALAADAAAGTPLAPRDCVVRASAHAAQITRRLRLCAAERNVIHRPSWPQMQRPS
jgi:hypothetical protein